MNKTIMVKKAKEALEKLRKLTPAYPKLDDSLEMNTKEAVFFMARELVQMTKRGFTIKELSEGLGREGIQIKPGTLNRYLNGCPQALENLNKSNQCPGAGRKKTVPKDKAAGIDAKESALENPKPTLDNPEPDGQIVDGKSDSSPEWEVVPSTVNEE